MFAVGSLEYFHHVRLGDPEQYQNLFEALDEAEAPSLQEAQEAEEVGNVVFEDIPPIFAEGRLGIVHREDDVVPLTYGRTSAKAFSIQLLPK
jgi:hypothetical protein